jgi:hypothetical protein
MSGRTVDVCRWDACRMCALWVADGARKLTNVNTDGTVRRGWTRADIARAEWRVAQLAQAETVAPVEGATWSGRELDDEDAPYGSACELCGERATRRVETRTTVPE